MAQEVELWSWDTPNGWKVEILFDELQIPYKYIPIDISKGDQFKDDFKQVSPNSKIPGIRDTNGVTVFESGAILIYFAQKTGKLLPDAKTDPAGNAHVLEWLMWQMAGFGPMLGQYNHFTAYAPEKIEYAIDRYTKEAKRLYKVLDTQLASNKYVAGNEYSIADIAIWGWAAIHERQKFDLANDFPNVLRWFELVKERPAVAKLWARLLEKRKEPPKKFSPEEMKILFGVEAKK